MMVGTEITHSPLATRLVSGSPWFSARPCSKPRWTRPPAAGCGKQTCSLSLADGLEQAR